MIIEAGKYYLNRRGEKLGPAVHDKNCKLYEWDLMDVYGHRVGYTKDGRWLHTGDQSLNDLVAEYEANDPRKDADPVNNPYHYSGHPSGVECIQITEHMSFCRGNAMKYLWRAGDKDNEVQDLEKAIWYLQREIGLIRKKTA